MPETNAEMYPGVLENVLFEPVWQCAKPYSKALGIRICTENLLAK
jgi:hypothetical protein